MVAITIPTRTVTVTKDDATVERVCFEYAWAVLQDKNKAGKLTGFVEATLAANPGISAADMVLATGARVLIPEFVIDNRKTVRRLWGDA